MSFSSTSSLSSQTNNSTTTLFSYVTAAEGYINSGNMNQANFFVQLYREGDKSSLTAQQRKEFQERIENVKNTIAIYQRSNEEPKRSEIQNRNKVQAEKPSLTTFQKLTGLASNLVQTIGKANLTALGIIGASFLYSTPVGVGLGALGLGYKIYSSCRGIRTGVRNKNLLRAPSFPQATQRVILTRARQYDRTESPAACSFHAICAMNFICDKFDEVATAIVHNQAANLSQMQNRIIDRGLQMYKEQKAIHEDLVTGADFQQIKIPNSLKFGKKVEEIISLNNNRDNLYELTLPIINHLFPVSITGKKIAWVKNINDESFALISNGTFMIVFDSHRNEILLVHKKNASEFLQKKILQEHFGRQDYNFNAFEYALGES
jgi:hypothetical protein